MFIVYHAKTEYGRENEKLFKQFVFFVNLSQEARNKKEGASPLFREKPLLQKAVDDLFLGLRFGKAQRHELGELLPGDLADGSLVDQRRV